MFGQSLFTFSTSLLSTFVVVRVDVLIEMGAWQQCASSSRLSVSTRGRIQGTGIGEDCAWC